MCATPCPTPHIAVQTAAGWLVTAFSSAPPQATAYCSVDRQPRLGLVSDKSAVTSEKGCSDGDILLIYCGVGQPGTRQGHGQADDHCSHL